jgi:ribosomal protein S6E (S10)
MAHLLLALEVTSGEDIPGSEGHAKVTSHGDDVALLLLDSQVSFRSRRWRRRRRRKLTKARSIKFQRPW